MQVYLGKNGKATREINNGCRVVQYLVTQIENFRRNIACDNFFTSLSLACKLPEKKLTIVGTIRKNKPELPTKFTAAKNRTAKSTLFGFQKDAIVASYCPKQNCTAFAIFVLPYMNMLSTMHFQPEVDEDSANKKNRRFFYFTIPLEAAPTYCS